MKITLDISLYPLSDQYRKEILEFIQQIKKHSSLKLETNGMSTQVFGEYDDVMRMLTIEMKPWMEQHKGMFVMKITTGERTKENLPKEFK